MAPARISRPLGELTRLSSAFVGPFAIVTPMTLVAPERRVLLSPALVGARFFTPATFVAPLTVSGPKTSIPQRRRTGVRRLTPFYHHGRAPLAENVSCLSHIRRLS